LDGECEYGIAFIFKLNITKVIFSIYYLYKKIIPLRQNNFGLVIFIMKNATQIYVDVDKTEKTKSHWV
jgi:hypothetical protein